MAALSMTMASPKQGLRQTGSRGIAGNSRVPDHGDAARIAAHGANALNFAPPRTKRLMPHAARILLTDDNDVLRASIAEQLSHEGFDVVTASGLEDARTALQGPAIAFA